MAKLKYVGRGAFLPDVPARDLTEEEAEQIGEKKLLASKLYKRQDAAPKKTENEVTK